MTSKARPPRLAQWIIESVAPSEDAPWILGDLADEMEKHAALSTPAAARRWYWKQAARSVAPLIKRRCVAALSVRRGDHMWHDLAQDIRFALRLSARAPLTTFVVVATLVLGLGAMTSVFSVVDAVLVRPLPFAESSRAVQLFALERRRNEDSQISYPDLQEVRFTSRAIDALGFGEQRLVTLDHDGEAQRLQAIAIDSGFVGVLDLRAGIGRMFGSSAYVDGTANEVVLTHGFWLRAFGGDGSIVGKPITIEGKPHTVVGVLEDRSFVFPHASPDVILPMRLRPGAFFTQRGVRWAQVVARARRGVSAEEVSRDVAQIGDRLATEFPNYNKGTSMRAKPLRDAVIGDVGSLLALLSAAVAAVVLIASLNVGNLLLARAATRSREFAIRVAIGGSPWRVRRQVMAEALLLSLIGGLLGLALAPLLTRALLSLYPGELPRAAEIHVSVRTVIAAVIGILITSILASFPAMRRAASARPSLDLRAAAGAGQTPHARRFGRFVFGAQIAASLTLVFVASLLVRTLREMNRIHPGFTSGGLLTFLAAPSPERQPSPAAYYQRLSEALKTIPGVSDVSTMWHVPFGENDHGDVFVREDGSVSGPRDRLSNADAVDPGFDRVMGARVLAGRAFTEADDSVNAPVAMINKTLAATAFAGEDPIGKLISFSGQKHRRIVGVIEDMKDGSLVDAAPGMLYIPVNQYPAAYPKRDRYVIVRTSRDPSAVMIDARATVRRLDASVPLTDVRSMGDRLSTAAAAFRFRAVLLGGLSALACLLALLGVYGIVAEGVNRQTREIGIRLALGMTPAGVQRNVLATSLRTTIVGVVIGLGLSLALASSLRTMLYGVVARDVLSLVLAIVTVTLAATIAAFVPARRASRIDPILALRSD
jgi:predicted permease